LYFVKAETRTAMHVSFLKFVCRFALFRLFRFCQDGKDCSVAAYFDKPGLGAEFNSKIFLYQNSPSTLYKYEDLLSVVNRLQSSGTALKFWVGDDCSAASQKAAYVNMAAFLGQAMRESIIFNVCDENNYDAWSAILPAGPGSLYPMSSACGQLGRNYGELSCDDACPQNTDMEMTATTNAGWYGAPPPLFCGPRSKYDGLGYWNPQLSCASGSCIGQPFYYNGQKSGVYVPVSKDKNYPSVYYANPLAGQASRTPPRTNVEGCCWWGRGVIQTTGRCNYGKLNKQLGAGAGSNALYPTINFCTNPQAICSGPPDVKWVAGIFFFITEVQSYNRDGFNYIDGVKKFVADGCAETIVDPNRLDCSSLFEYISGIVNSGCHNPASGNCGPALNVPERVAESQKALQALLKFM
jgi:hypothetical protein